MNPHNLGSSEERAAFSRNATKTWVEGGGGGGERSSYVGLPSHSRQTPPVQCRLPGPRSNEYKTNRRNFSFLIIENKIPQLLKIFSAVLVHI